MKSIILILVHPSPYNARWYDIISSEYNTEIYYNRKTNKYKTWKINDERGGKYLNSSSYIKLLNKIINSPIVFFDGWNYAFNIYAMILRKLLGRKNILFSDYPIKNKNDFVIVRVIKIIFLKLIISHVFGATESTCCYFKDYFKFNSSRILIFPYAHNFSIAKDLFDNNEQNLFKLKNGGRINILIASNFYKRKGYSILFDAFLLLNDKNLMDNFVIDICGNGEEYEFYLELSKKLNCNIKLWGWVDTNVYKDLLMNCDVLIHPSIIEPFGLPPLDAMELGKVVIVSDGVHSTKSLIIDSLNGFSYNKDLASELSDRLLKILKLRENIYQIGFLGKKSIHETYYPMLYIKALNKVLNIN